MIENLRNSRSGYAVHWMRFLKMATANPMRLMCVFEGEDSKYYGWRIDSFSAEPWVPINAGGRKNVEKIYELCLASGQHRDRAYFFVDRDFDEESRWESCPPEIFVTSDYSVENMYATDAAMERLLRDEFSCVVNGQDPDKLTRNQDCLSQVMESFRSSRDAFLRAIKPINAWIVCHRRRSGADAMLNISDLKISDFVQIGLNDTVPKFDLRELHEQWSNARFPTSDELRSANDFLESRSLLSTCRGKFIAQFLRIYIDRLKVDAASNDPELLKNDARPKISISDRNFLSELTQFADTPGRLREFISRMALPMNGAGQTA